MKELSRRALNRALLPRQFLLERSNRPVLDAIEHLAGLQAQLPNTPYIGLWTRLAGFRPEELSKAIENRRAVRIALMRSTIHLVSARDCLLLRPAMQPALDRSLYRGSPWGQGIVGMDIAELTAAARALLEEKPRNLAELGPLLRERTARARRSLPHRGRPAPQHRPTNCACRRLRPRHLEDRPPLWRRHINHHALRAIFKEGRYGA
jgi:hypothetical protein